MATPIKLAVFISGSGTNMVAIAQAIQAGKLDATIQMVVSSNAKAKGIQKAKDMGLPVTVFTPEDYADTEAVERKIIEILEPLGVEYIAMAGYMRKVTSVLLTAYKDRVINLHPALLPKYKGAHAIQDAYDAGDPETGITLHLANEEYDEGPILYQRVVPVVAGEPIEDLETRIHDAEHEAYPMVLQWIAEHGCVPVE